MRLMRFQTRLPTGQVEELRIEGERVLIGSGAHCEIRLPQADARVEHVLVELAAAGIFARALDFEPPPTINNIPFTVAPLTPGSILGIGGTQILVELIEGQGAMGGDIVQQKAKSSPLTLIAFMIIVPMSA